MKNVFAQNRIGSARAGAASASQNNLNSFIKLCGFRFRVNQNKTLNSITLKVAKIGTLADSDFPVYLVRPFLGVAYKICTITNGAATITLSSHQLQNNEKILMFGQTLPTGASARGTYYYVVNAAANTFNLSLTQGGSAITWGSPGSTVCFARVLDVGMFDMANVTSTGYYNCTGFTYNLEAGRLYYFLTLNHNSLPTSNYLGYITLTNIFEISSDLGYWNTSNLGTVTQNTLDFGLNGSVNFSDSTKIECRIASIQLFAVNRYASTHTGFVGNVFKTMPDAKIRLHAVAWKGSIVFSASPFISKNFVCELLDNSNNLIAISQAINNLDYTTTTINLIPFYFDTVQVLEPSTTYKIRIRTMHTGNDTTAYFQSDAIQFALDSTGTYYHKQIWNDGTNGVMFLSSFDGNTTYEQARNDYYFPCELWLDYTDPYDAVSSTYSYCFGN